VPLWFLFQVCIELADDALQQRLAAEHDIHNLGGVPD